MNSRITHNFDIFIYNSHIGFYRTHNLDIFIIIYLYGPHASFRAENVDRHGINVKNKEC